MAQALEAYQAIFVAQTGAANTLPWRYLATTDHVADLLDDNGDLVRELTLGVDFTVSPEGDTAAGAGSVTLLATLAAGETQLRVRNETPPVNLLVSEAGTEGIVQALDRFSMALQQFRQELDRIDVAGNTELAQAAAAQAAASAAEAAAYLIGPGGVQAYDVNLEAISALTFGANRAVYWSDANTAGTFLMTDFIRNMGSRDTAQAVRDYIELGSAALEDAVNDSDMTVSPSALPLRDNVRVYVGGRITANCIGWAQTWQDVSGSRAFGVAYQNTTGKPIMVAVDMTNNSDFEVSADGVAWVVIRPDLTYGAGGIIIPNGHYYRAVAGGAISSWVELR